MVDSNTVLGSGLSSLCSKWHHTSYVRPYPGAAPPPFNPAEQHPPRSSQSPSMSHEPPSDGAPIADESTHAHPSAAVRVPYSQDCVQDDIETEPMHEEDNNASHDQDSNLLQPGRELQDISGIFNKLLLKQEGVTAHSFVATGNQQDRPQARRLILSIESEQLPLEDERAAAQGYALLVAREEELAAAVRAASRREAEALAMAAAGEAEIVAARQELMQLQVVAEAMKAERCGMSVLLGCICWLRVAYLLR